MARRFLFGPVNPAFADQCLQQVRKEGACLAFDADGKTDLKIGPAGPEPSAPVGGVQGPATSS
jgi:hypothetical protein